MKETKDLPTTRQPLSELPLSDYVRDPNLPLSPVSLPLKRPATPGHATPKRVVELDADELGTGRSPARRLFDATPRASAVAGPSTSRFSRSANESELETSNGGGSASASASGSTSSLNGSVGALAPSPPLGSRRGSTSRPPRPELPTPSSSTSSTGASTPSSGRIHDPGFTVFSDDDVLARPVPPSVFVPVADADEENVPPAPEVEATPRRKRFEPSKLSTVTTSEPEHERIASGKQGMIAEADLA